ncbi:MAG: DUF2065 domain-containing protein [Xanthomonadales bacterium]|nr:DUF2065 domain-containing protein [Xanthomonadales bacterium]MCB1629238.1 DUF2065 domain-containing protein [Xanthomonadales bacterium]MCB1634216.1 DUF2065 domain-containing protein [Xanthomonadales bacterium]
MQDLWAALALVMVVEGLMPFASPAIWRQALARLISLDDRQLRMIGGASMVCGLVLLYAVRSI